MMATAKRVTGHSFLERTPTNYQLDKNSAVIVANLRSYLVTHAGLACV